LRKIGQSSPIYTGNDSGNRPEGGQVMASKLTEQESALVDVVVALIKESKEIKYGTVGFTITVENYEHTSISHFKNIEHRLSKKRGK
jgi:hypothetical protein